MIPASALDETRIAKDPAMEESINKSKPGEPHQWLEPFVGKWKCKIRTRYNSNEEFQFSIATSDNQMTLGNRFLRQTMNGEWSGTLFQGEGVIGYDNIRNEFQLVWTDNFSTGMMGGVGTYDPLSKTLRFTGDYSSPITNETARWFRSEWKVVNASMTIYNVYNHDSEGKEFQSMEIIYSLAE